MANESLASSARRRNSILRILSTNGFHLCNNDSSPPNPPSFFHEFDMLIGLAFTAVVASGHDVTICRSLLGVFFDHREEYEDITGYALVAAKDILRQGFIAFKLLGFPYYFDDFLNTYRCILKPTHPIPSTIKYEMQQILNELF